MTYLSSQPRLTDSWEDICYPIKPVWLAELLPDYDIVATDRQQLVVGEVSGGRPTIFGIQSADYTIIPNTVIREVIDGLIASYQLLIKYTPTGEFSINIILPEGVQLGKESLQRSLIITNSYNGKTPFSIQGQTLLTLQDPDSALRSSMFRQVCQNGLMGWADQFADIPAYQTWLHEWSATTGKAGGTKSRPAKGQPARPAGSPIRKIHHRQLTQDMFRQQLHDVLVDHLNPEPTLTATVYTQLQQAQVQERDEDLMRELPVPVQLTKQARERLRTEEHLLKTGSSYWLIYNAVNYALFTSRSSLTLNDRYRLDERVFHQLAARAYA
ncbi:hypothetical protein GCM10023189_27400 [Nibrella saemangeumensis]|uniref:DUF932 domain-containing protein n=1 Tax=Nibrella saemangeumensis TaxID=1084526 RepID=A0ABP8MZ46_9BACT